MEPRLTDTKKLVKSPSESVTEPSHSDSGIQPLPPAQPLPLEHRHSKDGLQGVSPG